LIWRNPRQTGNFRRESEDLFRRHISIEAKLALVSSEGLDVATHGFAQLHTFASVTVLKSAGRTISSNLQSSE